MTNQPDIVKTNAVPFSAQQAKMRRSGLDCVGDVEWGTHLCLFYRQKEDITGLLVPYFRAGLENNEACFLLASGSFPETEVRDLLAQWIPDCETYIRKGQLNIISYQDWYFKDGGFSVQKQIDNNIIRLKQSLASGFAGIRTFGMRDWVEQKDWRGFADYEEELNGMLSGREFLVMCAYAQNVCSTAQIIDVVRNHQFALVKRQEQWDCIEVNERRVMEEVVRSSERRYEAIFQNTGAATVIVEGDTTLSLVNREFEKMAGYPKEEIEGRKSWTDFVAEKSDADRMKEYHRLRRIDPNLAPNSYEFKFKDREGRIKDIFLTIDMIPGTKKSVASLVDITRLRNAERELEKVNKKLTSTNKKFKQLALRDPHTGLFNHRYLSEIIEAEFYRAKRYSHPLSAVMLDIDFFKSINDVYGHQFGDMVLTQLAKQLRRMVRPYDIVIRAGGEEFMIISPGTDRNKALILAHRILDAVNLYNFGDKKHSVKLKMSISVASYPDDKILSGIDLIRVSDLVLNKAKEFGGNRVYTSLDVVKKKSILVKGKSRKAEVQALKNRIASMSKRANQNSIEAIFAFARTIELKDHYTGEHAERTVYYATSLANTVGLPKDQVECVRKAAILHDLGKIGISEKILLKRSKLSVKEFSEIKKHPLIAVDIIRPIQFLQEIIPLVLYHHERWDGKGYPAGLKEEEIPIGARIVTLADVYQALTSDRPYRKAFTKEKAINILKDGAGFQFDPHLVEVFVRLLKKEKK
jgi:diguanylate cyclase (GGDEF)-like protein/PAS domain S-box-containing protein